MMYNFLFAFMIFTFISWALSIMISGDLFSPMSIFTLMFFFSALCANYSKNIWNFRLESKTFWLLISGISVFMVVSYIVQLSYSKKRSMLTSYSYTVNSSNSIEISFIKAFTIFFVVILLSFFYIIMMTKTVGGGGNIFVLASNYRNAITQEGKQMPFLGRLSLIIIRAIATTLVCIIINNAFAGTLKKNQGNLLILSVLAYIIDTLLSGERTSTMRLVAIGVLCFSIVWQRNNNYKKLVSVKYIILGIFATAVALYAFSSIRFFVGRKSELDILDYISFYAGGPLYNFNEFVNLSVAPNFTGENTFIGLFNNLARLGIGEINSIHRNSVVISELGIFMGNVYTCFYDYYRDFGAAGMMILTIIYSFIINILYFKAKYTCKFSVLNNMIYVFFASTLFFVSFTEQFYTSYITMSTIEIIVIMYITYIFIKAKMIGTGRFLITGD